MTVVALPRQKNRCLYCGAPTYGRTCRGHADLLRLDPYTNQGPPLPQHGSATGPNRKEA